MLVILWLVFIKMSWNLQTICEIVLENYWISFDKYSVKGIWELKLYFCWIHHINILFNIRNLNTGLLFNVIFIKEVKREVLKSSPCCCFLCVRKLLTGINYRPLELILNSWKTFKCLSLRISRWAIQFNVWFWYNIF